MKVIAAISSPEQDDVIEKILKARGQWDPPWSRPRRARGPPPSGASTPSVRRCTIDPQWDVDDYLCDPPGPADP